MFKHAITRRPGDDFARGLTTASLGTPDPDLALEQHDAYVRVLEKIGLEVLVLDALPGHPDACFVEDVAVVVPELAVITCPGAPERRGEVETIATRLKPWRRLETMEYPATLDGGDVLVAGRQVFVGVSGRSNSDGADFLAAVLTAKGYQCDLVEVGSGLHLKSSVNHLGRDVLLLTEDFASLDVFGDFETITVPDHEAYACNTLWINDHLLVPADMPETRERLSRLDQKIIPLEMSEFRKMDGGPTCLSLRLT